MKTLFALFALALVATVASALSSEELDKLDIDGLLADPEKVKKFAECALTDVCTDLGRNLRDFLVNALETKCAECTDVQKAHIRKAALYFIKEKNDVWQKFVAKYDPKGEHKEGFKKFLEGN
ncbi:hypothetical protein C0J52_20339 [Blattella germanica]|nr:hypothetical protein C0J52_20339 [Blattella germanica]